MDSAELCVGGEEIFRCILLNNKKKIRREEVVPIGSPSASIVHPRDTFKTAFVIGISSHLYFQTPERQHQAEGKRILLTLRPVQLGEVLGIQVRPFVSSAAATISAAETTE